MKDNERRRKRSGVYGEKKMREKDRLKGIRLRRVIG